MAVQTETYANIVARVEGLFGDNFVSADLTRLKNNVNTRARYAYKRYDQWPTFFQSKQFRRVNGANELQHVYTDSFGAEIAGIDQVDEFFMVQANEPYTAPGNYYPLDLHEQNDSSFMVGYEMQEFKAVGDISAIAVSAGVLTVTTGAGHGFKVGDTFKIEGAVAAAPAPDVNTSFVITSLVSSTQLVATHSYLGTASYTVGGTDDLLAPVAWCSYRKRNAVTYGDGAGETSTVPNEWSEFLVLGVYADMLRADGQSEKAAAEENRAMVDLDEEMWRADRRLTKTEVVSATRTHSNSARR